MSQTPVECYLSEHWPRWRSSAGVSWHAERGLRSGTWPCPNITRFRWITAMRKHVTEWRRLHAIEPAVTLRVITSPLDGWIVSIDGWTRTFALPQNPPRY